MVYGLRVPVCISGRIMRLLSSYSFWGMRDLLVELRELLLFDTQTDDKFHSLFSFLPFVSLTQGDPIDHRRCQSLNHPRPEPQAPALRE